MISRASRSNIYLAIQELHKNENLSILLLCEIAKICRAAYYKWLNRNETIIEKENKKIVTAILNLYSKVNGIHGYRRIALNLNRTMKKNYNLKRIYRIMSELGLKSIIRKKRKRYVTNIAKQVAENTLKRNFTAYSPNEKWLTDVTKFKYGDGNKAYLSAILDLYDRSIVSFVLGHSNNNQLVFSTLDLAIECNPGATPLLHSDRGFQYTSIAFKKKIEKQGMTQSMSRVGKCIDNGPMEGYWGILKSESYYLKNFETFEELEEEIKRYILFYNEKRLQKKLNSRSPIEYRTLTA